VACKLFNRASSLCRWTLPHLKFFEPSVALLPLKFNNLLIDMINLIALI
jgi:hypothetical protein